MKIPLVLIRSKYQRKLPLARDLFFSRFARTNGRRSQILQIYSNLSNLFSICMICTDLWDFCPLGHSFLVRLRRSIFFSRFARTNGRRSQIFQIYSNLSNLAVWNDLYDLYRFVRFLPVRAFLFSIASGEKSFKSIQIFQIFFLNTILSEATT